MDGVENLTKMVGHERSTACPKAGLEGTPDPLGPQSWSPEKRSATPTEASHGVKFEPYVVDPVIGWCLVRQKVSDSPKAKENGNHCLYKVVQILVEAVLVREDSAF